MSVTYFVQLYTARPSDLVCVHWSQRREGYDMAWRPSRKTTCGPSRLCPAEEGKKRPMLKQHARRTQRPDSDLQLLTVALWIDERLTLKRMVLWLENDLGTLTLLTIFKGTD